MGEPNPHQIPLISAPPVPAICSPPSRTVTGRRFVGSRRFCPSVRRNAVDADQIIRQRLNEVRPNLEPCKPCTIFRFPDKWQKHGDDGKDFRPLVVSIGPYHISNNTYGTAKAMQDHKWRCVRHLLSRHQNPEYASQLLDRCLVALKALDTKVRSCYLDILYLDPSRLASVMLMDGCFIIHLLLKQVENESIDEGEEGIVVVVEEESKEVESNKGKEKVEDGEDKKVELEMGKGEEEIEGHLLGMSWVWNLVIFDLLKLENQIPFFVIQTIFDIIRTPRDKGMDLVSLALGLFHDIHPKKYKGSTTMPASRVHHLLHLFHSSLVPCDRKLPAQEPSRSQWLPSAMDLKRCGIKFVKAASAECSLDVSFHNGGIEIPPLQVYEYSRSIFQNLIQFEQCFSDVGTYFTNYARFMECIISSGDDAKLLCSKGIVVNRLGNDEVVADIFRRHTNLIQYVSDVNYLADVFSEARKHHESRWRRWRAQIVRDYFSNPWTGLAVIAAVLLLLLVAMNTFSVSIHPDCALNAQECQRI